MARSEKAQKAYETKLNEVLETGDSDHKFRDDFAGTEVADARAAARNDGRDRLKEIEAEVKRDNAEQAAYDRARKP